MSEFSLIRNSSVVFGLVVTAILYSGCSGMVAPVNKGGTSATLKTSGGDDANPEGGAVPDDESGGGPESAGGNTPQATPVAATKKLGKFSDTSGEALKAASGYAMYTDMGMLKSLAITVTEAETDENAFRKVVGWECKPCTGADESKCKTADPVATKAPTQYSITFTKPFMPGATAQANENGWPLKAKSTIVATPPEPTLSAMLIPGDAPTASVKGTGTIDFGASIPAKVGDKFTALIDVEFGGKKHTTKLESVVVSMGTPATPPADCTAANKKYLFPKYE